MRDTSMERDLAAQYRSRAVAIVKFPLTNATLRVTAERRNMDPKRGTRTLGTTKFGSESCH